MDTFISVMMKFDFYAANDNQPDQCLEDGEMGNAAEETLPEDFLSGLITLY